MVKKERNSNFELMRIVSMLLIVLCHALNLGNLIYNCANPALKIFLEILMFATLVHVNSYVLLSGYFQSKSNFKFSKLLKMISQVVFYLILFLIIAIKLGWVDNYNIVTFINDLLPSSISSYWFINVYIITYIFSDYINKFINKLSRREYKNFIVIGFIILFLLPFLSGFKFLDNSGYNFYSFIYLYIVGGYLRRYPLKETYHFKRMSINGYRMFMLFVFCLMFFSNYLLNNFGQEISGMSNIYNEISTRLLTSKFAYSTPFVLIQTIAYFEIFKTYNLKSKIINAISKNVLGVYLFHENPYVREHIYSLMKINTGEFYSYKKFAWVLIAVIIIFLIGILIELIRALIEKIIIKMKPTRFFVNKFKELFNSFNFNINW